MDLQRLRHDYKLSQSELASILGCKQSNISTMENSSKPLSALNVKILIEKYGYEAISKYADATELPPVSGGSGSVEAVNSNVQNGDGNSITADATLIKVMKQQSDQNSALISELAKRSEQIDRLISLLEKSR